MGALVRLAILAAVVALIIGAVRSYLRSTGHLARRGPEPEMPYCLKCESTRNVVVNRGQGRGAERWYCTRCREGF